MSQRQKDSVFSFPYTFAEEAFLGCRMKDDVGTVLIPLKRSVISLQVVRKPLVPYFPGRAAEHRWWREAGGQGLKGTPTWLLVLRQLLLSYQVSLREALKGTLSPAQNHPESTCSR